MKKTNVVCFPPSYLLSNQRWHYCSKQWVSFVSCSESWILSGWKQENKRTPGLVYSQWFSHLAIPCLCSPMHCQKKNGTKMDLARLLMSKSECLDQSFLLFLCRYWKFKMKEIAQAGTELKFLFSELVKDPLLQSCFLTVTATQNITKTAKLECMGLHRPFGLVSLEHQLFWNAINRQKNLINF